MEYPSIIEDHYKLLRKETARGWFGNKYYLILEWQKTTDSAGETVNIAPNQKRQSRKVSANEFFKWSVGEILCETLHHHGDGLYVP